MKSQAVKFPLASVNVRHCSLFIGIFNVEPRQSSAYKDVRRLY